MTYPGTEALLGAAVVRRMRSAVSPRQTDLFRRVSSHFDRKGTFSVLDFGCEAGFLCRHISQTFPPIRIEGVDLSARMIEQAKANCPWGIFFVGDADSPKLAGYDVIVACDALDTIVDIPEALRKLDAHLYPGGRFIVACRAPACVVHEQVRRTLTELAYRVSFEEFESEPRPEERDRLSTTVSELCGPDRSTTSELTPRPESYWIIAARRRSEAFHTPCQAEA